MLLIRPHHINCLFFFKGLGYNYQFTKHMKEIVSHLHKNPAVKIKLVSHCDMICTHCPNKSSADICLCDDDNKVKLLDETTLEFYNLKLNHQYYFTDILNDIYKEYDYEKFFNICNQCEWFKKGVCSKDVISDQKKKWLAI